MSLSHQVEDARRSILHVKCQLIEHYSDKLDRNRNAVDSSADGTHRRLYGSPARSSGCTVGLLWTLVVAIAAFQLAEAFVWYRCSQFGGRNCQFPFGLLPVWLWTAREDYGRMPY